MAPIEKSDSDEIEKPQIVKDLEAVDDKYLALEKEYDNELNKIIAKFTAQQKPFLEERAVILAGSGKADDPKTGTPALSDFWLKALQNHPAFKDEIENYDEPVLRYIKDITVSNLDPDDRNNGFVLKFHFAQNPYFENDVLCKEYHTIVTSPYTAETDVTKIKGCTIAWNVGKNVTVETVKKPTKTGSKKTKQAKVEPRDSFFRSFFRSLAKDEPLPDDIDPHEVAMSYGAEVDDMDAEDMVCMILESDHDLGVALRDNIIPFAVRWYTGEAAPNDDDDEDGEEEEDEDDSEEEDESPNNDKINHPPKKELPVQKKEECKQQ